MLPPIERRIADELAARPEQVATAISLLDEGATVPFIARYRKEATGGLDDTQLRTLEERLGYLRELEERRGAVLASIEEQGKLSDSLRASIHAAETKQRLEDLYLPYKRKRRTRAQIAIEAGLEPLADALLGDPTLDPEAVAADYLREPFTTEAGDNPGVPDVEAALAGARQVLMDRWGEDPDTTGALRSHQRAHGHVVARVTEGKESEGAKFRDWFEYDEPLAKVPSHRALALFRGRAEDILRIELKDPVELADADAANPCEGLLASRLGIHDQGRPADRWLGQTVRITWRAKLGPRIETALFGELREQAEEEAIRVFGRNLKDLLLAAPAGQRSTMGLDPGLRTGVKVAVVDGTGKLVATATIYPHAPRNDRSGSLATLARLAKAHGVQLAAIGNGTASRETDELVAELIKAEPALGLHKVMVSEAGASVYSASEFAAREFPELDVSLRGAVSIARRLQDPLAELVKIEPKAIGVGQYQHDVSQVKLGRTLTAVVEDCVNGVGVDLNTASAPLLAAVAGLSSGIAENIVARRDSQGPFRSRRELLDVSRLGPKAFEQAAGFLRVSDGDNPLDASAVHPEAYPVVEAMAADTGKDVRALIGDAGTLRSLDPGQYTSERFGLPTVKDILAELEKPGRDPRPEFRTATFREDVHKLTDLEAGMRLEGVVTNVTNFGAFVDVGVHQDGLVHISVLADRFVKDPHEVVKAGDVVKVRVLEVDVQRKRIALSMRSGEAAERGQRRPDGERQRGGGGDRPRQRGGRRQDGRAAGGQQQQPQGAMAQALANALNRGK